MCKSRDKVIVPYDNALAIRCMPVHKIKTPMGVVIKDIETTTGEIIFVPYYSGKIVVDHVTGDVMP